MAQSLTDIILHIVFSTKERRPWIQSDIEDQLYAYISGICKNLNSPIIRINGMADHIHLLLHLSKTIAVSDLISNIKSNASRWIKTQGESYKNFSWQGGYGGFSVSRPSVEGAIKYIANQKEHHKTVSFKEELITLLERGQISYNEQYLWD
jgi:putative transposase